MHLSATLVIALIAIAAGTWLTIAGGVLIADARMARIPPALAVRAGVAAGAAGLTIFSAGAAAFARLMA